LYILKLERDLQIMLNDPTFAFPYWDWSGSPGFGDPVLDAMGGNGNTSDGICGSVELNICNCTVTTGPFAYWPAYQGDGEYIGPLNRAFACESINVTSGYALFSQLPSIATTNAVLTFAQYTTDPHETDLCEGVVAPGDFGCPLDFASLLEGQPALPGFSDYPPLPVDMHNAVHVYIGGLMSNVPVAANDPIFWLNHVYVDSLLEKWIRKTEAAGFTLNGWPKVGIKVGHNFDEALAPFLPIVTHERMFQNSDAFGYEYDYLIPTPTPPPPPNSTVQGNYLRFVVPAGCPTGPSTTCCPSNCGGPSRGQCTDVTVPSNNPVFGLQHLEGMIWLTQNFTSDCVCTDQFTGPDCSECWYGWTGPNCDVKHVNIRKNFRR